MNVDLGILGRLTRVVLLLLVAAGFLAVGLWYTPLIQKNEALRKDILALEKDIAEKETLNKRLRAHSEALARDPKTIERQARERLSLAKPGEVVFRFTQPSASSPAAAPNLR